MVLFCDVVGFTSMSKEVEASQVQGGGDQGMRENGMKEGGREGPWGLLPRVFPPASASSFTACLLLSPLITLPHPPSAGHELPQ